MIGRATELDELASLLRDPANRLVTLVGPGGETYSPTGDAGSSRGDFSLALGDYQVRARKDGALVFYKTVTLRRGDHQTVRVRFEDGGVQLLNGREIFTGGRSGIPTVELNLTSP